MYKRSSSSYLITFTRYYIFFVNLEGIVEFLLILDFSHNFEGL